MSTIITNLFLLFILIFLSQSTSSLSKRCYPEDDRILLQIKKELNNPSLLSSWKPNTDCCINWEGVACSSLNNQRVVYLSISNDINLSSQFPPSIGNLTNLQLLYLIKLPNLTGPFPQFITKLTKLEYLTITSTGLTGPIPDFNDQFRNLLYLDLSNNKLYGTLPPSLYKLPSLTHVLLYNNNLTGSIPPTYGYFNNSNLISLQLSHNKLYGKLPISLAKLDLYVLVLANNKFEGDASMLFGSNKKTSGIYISGNHFAFDFGKIQLSKTITSLDVSHNKIYGNFPRGIENVTSLNVSYNRLCGEIPKTFVTDVSSFSHNKCLCGYPLPSCKSY